MIQQGDLTAILLHISKSLIFLTANPANSKLDTNQSTQQLISPFIFYISFQKGEEGEKAKTISNCSEEQKFATKKNLKV